MKKKYILPLSICVFIIASAFTTYSYVTTNYEPSDFTDLSFEERFVLHDDEILSLENYYVNVTNNPSVVNDYNTLMVDFEDVIIDQQIYMENNNITFDMVRNNPSILPTNFHISTLQYNQAMNVINTTMPVSSPELSESLMTLNEYIDLAVDPDILYTPLEMFDDATGGFEEGGMQRNTERRGLKSKEAVRKLRDLLRSKGDDLVESVSIYPNPVTNFSRIRFYNAVEGKANFTLYNINGSVISSTDALVPQGESTLNVGDVMNTGKLTVGIYILRVKTKAGDEMSNKFIVK